jgi:tRNA (adenine37-N6)-methyltransferase
MPIVVEPVGPDGSIRMHPIGIARIPVQSQQTGGFVSVESHIELGPEFTSYLRGLEDYSHILVLYWMHEQSTPKAVTRPQGNPVVPEVGMFACRWPQRPNPVGLTTVRLLGIDGTTLRLEGLDVIDGTAVIDIKPYYPPYDEPKGEVRVPDWIDLLQY